MQTETLAARWESLRATRPSLRARDVVARWESLRATRPSLRARDVATRVGVVWSLELYDGDTNALVFRNRDDRERAEDAARRGLLDRIEDAR